MQRALAHGYSLPPRGILFMCLAHSSEMSPASVKDTVTTDEEDNEIYTDNHA